VPHKKNKFQQGAFDRALTLLTGRDHSGKQLERKLVTRGYDREEIRQVLTKLEDLSYLDDLRYACMVIRDRVNMKCRGLNDARVKLMEAGVEKEIIEQAINDTQDEIDEYESCKIAANKKASTLRESDRQKRYIKLSRHLASRGFPFDTVREIVKNILENERKEKE